MTLCGLPEPSTGSQFYRPGRNVLHDEQPLQSTEIGAAGAPVERAMPNVHNGDTPTRLLQSDGTDEHSPHHYRMAAVECLGLGMAVGKGCSGDRFPAADQGA